MSYVLEVDRCLKCGLTYEPMIMQTCGVCGGDLEKNVKVRVVMLNE